MPKIALIPASCYLIIYPEYINYISVDLVQKYLNWQH